MYPYMRRNHRGRPLLAVAVVLAIGLTACSNEATPSTADQTADHTPDTSAVVSPALTQQLAAARVATAKYAFDLDAAQRDGYGIITPMMPEMGFHYLNPKVEGFDVTRPAILVYNKTGATWQLGALEWVFPAAPSAPPIEGATYGLFAAACHYKDGTFVPAGAEKECAPTNGGSAFNFWHPDLTTLHVWLWLPNPAGLYHGTNPLVQAYPTT
jgi:hypothetical protein